ncbi:MAG: alpha/beta fold hydrolase [Pseudomonadota bacterium]
MTDPTDDVKTVAVIHGLGRGRGSMRLLAERLRREGFAPVLPDYASTQLSVEEAERDVLSQIRAAVPEGDRLHLVGHSLGGVLALRLKVGALSGRARRVVQLGSPNGGSALASFAKSVPVIGDVMGPATEQIGEADLGPLTLAPDRQKDLGIIAGRAGWLPYTRQFGLDTENDGKVTVESALSVPHGNALVLDVGHMMLPLSSGAARQTIAFLRSGRFDRTPQ